MLSRLFSSASFFSNARLNLLSTKWVALSAFILAAIYGLYIVRFYFNGELRLGVDYFLFFARMISAEFYFSESGFLHVPAFTPAFCAGGFQASNPNDITYSFPQILSLLTDPLTAVYLSHFLLFCIGSLSTYALARSKPFSLDPWVAFAAAVVFGFNSFYLARMVLGHLNFHSFMLLPLLTYTLLLASTTTKTTSRVCLAVTSGTIAAIIFHAGGVHLVIPMALSILLVLYLASLFESGPKIMEFVTSTAISIAVSAVLSASKLVSMYYLSSNFPRDLYPIIGVPSLFDAITLPLTSLIGMNHISQVGPLQSHEFEYSLSPLIIPGILMALFFGLRHHQKQFWRYLSLIAPIAALVIAVTYTSEAWLAVLKTVPVVKESFSLFRWYISFMLPMALVCMIAIQRIKHNVRYLLIIATIVGTPLWQISTTPEWKTLPQIGFPQLLLGLEDARTSGVKPISRLGVDYKSDGSVLGTHASADARFPSGISQILCYEPILGYQVEKLRLDNLRDGPVTLQIGNELNMKNPACYVYPKANNCQPGDNFRIDQADELRAFVQYKPWNFKIPPSQKIANMISIASWVITTFLLLGWLILRLGKSYQALSVRVYPYK